VDEEALNLLRQQIRAEEATAVELRRKNDLAEKTLRQAEIRERNRLGLLSDISEKTGGLVAELPELKNRLLSLEHLVNGLVEKLGEYGQMLEVAQRADAKRFTQLEYGLMLLLQGKGNGNKAKAEELLRDIEASRTRELLHEHQRMLTELEVKRARYGDLEAPAWLLIQIEDLKQEIEGLKK
jgi:chromosome segregation ATPase